MSDFRIRQGPLLPPPRRVVILRALKLGDMLCAVPALRAFRAAWPSAEIVLVGLPWAEEFASRFAHLLDGFRALPGIPGLPEQPPQLDRVPEFFAALRAERFDLAIQLHGRGTLTNPLTRRFGARRCAGFFRRGEICPDPALFLPWPERGLELRRLLALAEFLGAPPRGEQLEFPIHEPDRRRLAAIEGARDLEPGDYVCIHPGASVPERRWPADRFAAVAAHLARRGLNIVITGGASESSLAREVLRDLPGVGLDLTGQTDLGTLGALLADARLLVCNDTGVSHLAAALRVPSVVLSTGDNPARWSPPDTRLHRVLCLDPLVPVADVVAEAEVHLQRHAPRSPILVNDS